MTSVEQWDDIKISPGESANFSLAVSESYSGSNIKVPIHVRRGLQDGPTVFVTGALHGDELNGTGTIRQLIRDKDLVIRRGSLILVPVLNILAFERHSRYLPDRRDLNRCFPGSSDGSLASRMAKTLFDALVSRSDYGIDLHTAAVKRTNYPTVRGDLSIEKIKMLASAFGGELIVDSKGPRGSFRKEATKAGCPTIIVEGGEVWKVEPRIVAYAAHGVKNVLRKLEMIEGTPKPPKQQVIMKKTRWIRADNGGFLEFHVQPGEVVKREQPLATSTGLLGDVTSVISSPFEGVVIGMTTLPALSPGEPVCHIGKLPRGVRAADLTNNCSDLKELLIEDLASNLLVVDPPSE